MNPAVSLRQVSFTYKGQTRPALSDMDFSLETGQCALITGPGNAGKTTLCHTINGLIPQVQEGALTGTIAVGGKDVSRYRVQTLARSVGLVMQDPEVQIVGRTVAEDMAFGPRNFLVPEDEIAGRISRALSLVDLAGYEKRFCADLSGGEKQRLAVAGILAMEPEILVLDAPASELNPAARASLYQALYRLNRDQGITLIIVDQEIDDILEMADHVIVMAAGRMVRQVHKKSPADALDKREIFNDRESFSPLPLPVKGAFASHPEAPSSASPSAPPPRSGGPEKTGQPLIKIRRLCFAPTSGVFCIQDIDLTLFSTDFLAVMGHNGAGKTTLARHLNGLEHPTSGTISFRGTPMDKLKIRDITRSVGHVFQNPDHQIFSSTVEKEVGEGLRHRDVGPQEITRRVDRVLKQTGLEAVRKAHPFTLGKGMRQLTALASIMVLEPEVLVVDEPTTGLDADGTKRVMAILERLHREGTAIVLITHDLHLAATHARRLLVMKQGRILLDDDMEKTLTRQEILWDAGLVPASCFKRPAGEHA